MPGGGCLNRLVSGEEHVPAEGERRAEGAVELSREQPGTECLSPLPADPQSPLLRLSRKLEG